MTSLKEPAQALPRDDTCPEHVAIIMDGNGRWASERGLPHIGGHRAGTGNLRRVVKAFAERGVKYLTIYAFSTENWNRPEEEVKGLWKLLAQMVRRERDEFHRNGVRLMHIGRRNRLSRSLTQAIDDAVELTRDNTAITLIVALDYGGRAEIVEAVRRLISSGVPPDEITEQTLSASLYTAGVPDPDLVIRTAGEMRLSNFLPWQTVYAEYYFTRSYWPDFDEEEVGQALEEYRRRQRRFGGVPPSGPG